MPTGSYVLPFPRSSKAEIMYNFKVNVKSEVCHSRPKYCALSNCVLGYSVSSVIYAENTGGLQAQFR